MIEEAKAAWRGLSPRHGADAFRYSPFEERALVHVFRKRPFGIVRWENRILSAEYGGGPCLNVGPNVDRCPFPMPADPPADGSQPSWWFAKQTVRRTAGCLELALGPRRHRAARSSCETRTGPSCAPAT